MKIADVMLDMRKKQLVSNAPTIYYWITVRDNLINCCFVRGQRMDDWYWRWTRVNHCFLLSDKQAMLAQRLFWQIWHDLRILIHQFIKLSWRENSSFNKWQKVSLMALELSDLIRDRLHWLRVPQRIPFKCVILTYKVQNGLAPNYISSYCQRTASVQRHYDLRSSTRNSLVIPKQFCHSQ